MIKVKRVYDKPTPIDGYRILVGRLWPRGLKKEDAAIDEWMKYIAPSHELRKWYGHEEARWPEFKKRYLAELKGDVQKELEVHCHKRFKDRCYPSVCGKRRKAQQCGNYLRVFGRPITRHCFLSKFRVRAHS